MAKQILLVEDEVAARRCIKSLLQRMNKDLVIVEAGDGSAAFGLLCENQFDLVISDITMPGGMSGTDLKIASEGAGIGIPFIFMSCYASEEDMSFMQGRGEFIGKPLDICVLGAMVSRSLGLQEKGALQ